MAHASFKTFLQFPSIWYSIHSDICYQVSSSIFLSFKTSRFSSLSLLAGASCQGGAPTSSSSSLSQYRAPRDLSHSIFATFLGHSHLVVVLPITLHKLSIASRTSPASWICTELFFLNFLFMKNIKHTKVSRPTTSQFTNSLPGQNNCVHKGIIQKIYITS